jgi:misacylated tRNA(Ala) deacylase
MIKVQRQNPVAKDKREANSERALFYPKRDTGVATLCLFRDNAYLNEAAATVVEVTDRGGIVLDQTVFYVTGGGQPGDSGVLKRADGASIEITTTLYSDTNEIVHVPAAGVQGLHAGESVTATIDWQRRYRHMRIHTGLHLLTVVLPFPVTGGRISTEEGHLDFDIDGPVPAKEEIQQGLSELLAQHRTVSTEWITDEELLANPGLIKTRAVKPPLGTGRVRLVRIGDIDLQPCGGTHVRSTSEVGHLAVVKVDNKGRQNRRVRVRLSGE